MKINKLIASLLAVSLLAFPVVQVSADENISLTVNGANPFDENELKPMSKQLKDLLA